MFTFGWYGLEGTENGKTSPSLIWAGTSHDSGRTRQNNTDGDNNLMVSPGQGNGSAEVFIWRDGDSHSWPAGSQEKHSENLLTR